MKAFLVFPQGLRDGSAQAELLEQLDSIADLIAKVRATLQDDGMTLTVDAKPPSCFDISQLAINETAMIKLEGLDGTPLTNSSGQPLSVTVYGPGSKQFQKAQARRNLAILDFVRKGGKNMKDDKQREIDATFLATCTVSFNGFTYQDLTGYEMFKGAYSDPKIGFVAEQVNGGINDWATFSR